MRTGVAAVQNTLTPPAQNVLRHAIHNAQSCGHTQVQPLHVAAALLSHGGPLLRQACADLHTETVHGMQQCHALEVCFDVALKRLPQSSSNNAHPLAMSHALVTALKRAQAHQKRGCRDQQQPPLVAVKVEIEQLIISILEDPGVSKVMKEARFDSQQVKTNLENAISSSSSLQQGGRSNQHNVQPFASDSQPPLVGCIGGRPTTLLSPWNAPKTTEDQKLLCCSECISHFNAEWKQLHAPECTEAEVVVSSLPSWLQKEKDIKSEQEKCHSLAQKRQDLEQKWQLVCRTSHSAMGSAIGLVPPHNWTDGGICNNKNTLGMMAVNSTSLPPVDFNSLPTPKPSQVLASPHWTHGLPSIAIPEGPIYSGVTGIKSQRMEIVEKQSTTSVSCDSSNNSSPLQLGGLRPVDPSRSQSNPSPLSRLHANQPKSSSTSGCPLRSQPLSSSPLAALKAASKPVSKSPLMVPPKLPSKTVSPLSQPLAPSLKNDKPPVFFDQKAAERLKHVYKDLREKVSWQGNAISQIATTLVNAQSGMGKLRGLAARADTWLLLLGPDQVGKRLVAEALAELVMGMGKKPVCFGLIQQDKDLAFSRWGRKGHDEDGVQQRDRKTLDLVYEALRTNPLCVLLLEDIDQADSVVRMHLASAMETGKFMDSSKRQVNVGNAIILMTSKVGTSSISGANKDNPFCEEKLSLLHGARMKLALEPPIEKELVPLGHHKISVVKDVTFAPVVDTPVNLPAPGIVFKRKPGAFLKQSLSMHCEKRPKLMACTLSLDLNLSAEENEAGACLEENGSSSQESKACDSNPVLNAACEALSSNFFNLVDNFVVFEPFDSLGQANWALSQLSRACSGLICLRIEVDFQLLEHMVGIIWRTPGGKQAFETWVQEKLKSSLNAVAAAQSGGVEDRVLRFVYEDSFSKEMCSASELPLQIEVGSR